MITREGKLIWQEKEMQVEVLKELVVEQEEEMVLAEEQETEELQDNLRNNFKAG